MASRGFFGYDPYEYYYPASPYGYSSYPYYRRPDAFFPDAQPAEPLFYPHRQCRSSAPRAPARNDDVFDIEITEPAAREPAARRGTSGSSKKSPPASFPIEVTGPDPPAPKRRAPSAEDAAVRLQAAARGLMARKMVREVRAVEREAEAVAARVATQAEALRGDARARVGVGEELMRLLLRLDGVRGAREYRRRVTRRVLALQDAVDALEAMPALVTHAPEAENAEEEADEMAPELQIEACTVADPPAAETDTGMEVDGVSPGVLGGEAGQTETELVAKEEKAVEAEGEWEMVATGEVNVSTDEEDPVPAKPHQQEPAGDEKNTEVAAADGLDARRLMDMVAALCERSAQQCELIGALADRVDTLERAVRRVEEADRRRRRNKKINKDPKKSPKNLYSD